MKPTVMRWGFKTHRWQNEYDTGKGIYDASYSLTLVS